MQLAFCPQHPSRQLDTICYHEQCQQNQQQLLCTECVLANTKHSSHPQYIEALHPTASTFRLLNSLQLKHCRDELLQELSKSNQFIEEVETAIMGCLREWKLTRLAKMECLINSLDQRSIPSILNNIQTNFTLHSSCCISVLNFVHENQESSDIGTDFRNAISDQLKRQINGLLVRAVNVMEIFKGMMVSDRYEEFVVEESDKVDKMKSIIEDFERKMEQKLNIKNCDENDLSMNDNGEQVETFQQENNLEIYNQDDDDHLNELSEQLQARKQFKKRLQKIKYFSKKKNKKNSVIDLFDDNSQIMEFQSKVKEQQICQTNKPANNVTISQSMMIPQSNIPTAPLTRRRRLLNEPIINLDSSFEPFNPNSILREKIAKKTNKPLPNLSFIQPCKNMLIIEQDVNQNEIINYLHSNPEIQFLTINCPALTQDDKMSNLLEECPHIKGIHIQCQHYLTVDFINKCKIEYFTFVHNYRWIAEQDNLIYFPLKEPKEVPLQMPITNKIKGSYSAHNKNQFDLLRPKSSEINIFTLEQEHPWSISDSKIFQLKNTCTNIRILSFTDIRFNKRGVRLLPVYQNNSYLHTLVFNNCPCNLYSIVNDFAGINEEHLQHLQISYKEQQIDCCLTQQSFQKICRLKNIQTLILVNLIFKKTQNLLTKKNTPPLFKDLQKLQKLTHLNLYGSEGITTSTINELSPNCYEKLITLNLGRTHIKSSARFIISKLKNLKNLNLDYTQIDAGDFLEFMPKLHKLQRLSIEGLNGNFISNDYQTSADDRERYGFLSDKYLQLLSSKSLIYVNISGCDQLRLYNWKQFPQLQFLIRGKNDPVQDETYQQLKNHNVLLIRLTRPNRPQLHSNRCGLIVGLQSGSKKIPFHVDHDRSVPENGSPTLPFQSSRMSARLRNARQSSEKGLSAGKQCLGCQNSSSKNQISIQKEPKTFANGLAALLKRKIVDNQELVIASQ